MGYLEDVKNLECSNTTANIEDKNTNTSITIKEVNRDLVSITTDNTENDDEYIQQEIAAYLKPQKVIARKYKLKK